MLLATIESLIGSTFASFAALFIGYIAGNILPMQRISEWFKK